MCQSLPIVGTGLPVWSNALRSYLRCGVESCIQFPLSFGPDAMGRGVALVGGGGEQGRFQQSFEAQTVLLAPCVDRSGGRWIVGRGVAHVDGKGGEGIDEVGGGAVGGVCRRLSCQVGQHGGAVATGISGRVCWSFRSRRVDVAGGGD